MYTTTIDEVHRPLKKIIIESETLERSQAIVASLQKHYLKNRDNSGIRDLNSTLKHLSALAMSYDLADSDGMAVALSWYAMGLGEIHQIFHDPKITEAFCNEIGTEIVVTHQKYGRCLTNIRFTEQLWDSLKIRAEYDTGDALTPVSPSLKVGFATPFGNLRISLQLPPLTPNSPAFNIRRLPHVPIDMQKLIRDEQISKEYANILVDAIKNRSTIIIAGEPGSGKTTLANALLLNTDPAWRLIIMEDAREVNINTIQFPMTTRYFMPSVGDSKHFSRRSDEIAKLLHRSPDYVFLGELQNADDTKVAFEGFAAGLRGMATTHARDLSGLLSRWTNSHGLNESLIKVIDYIVFTTRIIENGKSILHTSAIYKINGEDVEVM